VGPWEEAYGSFGVTGGILYMFLLGLIIRWAYYMVFKLAKKIPLLLFWIPVLFYQVTYSMETDTLQINEYLVKGSFFLWLIYQFTPAWFNIIEKKSTRLPSNIQQHKMYLLVNIV